MDLMIDIETLGVDIKAPVISIGACFFDESGIKEKFYAVLDVSHQIDSGLRKVDASTIKWWMGQEGAAAKVFREEAIPTISGIREFIAWAVMAHGKDNIKPWGNGPNFDITILESLFKDYGQSVPWDFRNIRDLRTFKEYVYDGSETERVGTHHNALDDAIYQAQVVIDGLNKDKKDYTPKPLSLGSSFALFLADVKARMDR